MNLKSSKKLNEKKEDNDALIKFYKSLANFYKTENTKMLKLNESLSQENDQLQEKMVRMQNQMSKYNHKLYFLISFILKIYSKLFPINSKRQKLFCFIKRIIKNFLLFLRKTFIFLLKFFVPKKLKRKIKNKLYNSKYLSKVCGLTYNGYLPRKNVVINNRISELNNLCYIDKTIAVHLHLYYLDLASEFYKYLLNIPYQFDLYISINDKTKVHYIKSKFSKILNVNKVIVKYAENCGRDYGPMFVLFGNELKKYDYLLHIHTKKSLRMGSSQDNWRHYLLDNLLGTREMVMQYFDLMINYNVGICYPDTFYEVPYIAHTYLGVRNLAQEFYKKLNLNFDDTYLNFSAGSMFWCKVELIEDVLNLNLTWQDFGEEHGQDDGTLEYVMERIYDPLIKAKKMNYATYNNKDSQFYINFSNKNLFDYLDKDQNDIIKDLSNYSVITFDIFDTLVTRKIYNPDDIFLVVDSIVERKFDFKSMEFLKIRKKAEENVRIKKNYIGDCSIHEIYTEMANIKKISKSDLEKIKKIEIDTDMKFIEPRKDVLEIYNKLLEDNKEIVLVSDMYYTSDIIKKILNKCGYYNWYKLLISSETGLRKDNNTAWQPLFESFENFIHVGDNEESDVHMLMVQGKPWIHLMMGKKLYEISKFYNKSSNNLENSIMKGLIINGCLFNSPFAINKDNKGVIKNLYEYGYSILGPIFLYFFIWLIKTVKNKKILFVSREGHYLQKIYKHIVSKSALATELDNIYFLISRRAISNANIKNFNDIKNILKVQYSGSLKELFYYRFGIILDEQTANILIELPKDINYVIPIAKQYSSIIIQNSKNESINYKKYVNNSQIDLKKDNLFIVDLGYSGSAQYELSKLLNIKIDGAYFIVNDNLKPISLGEKVYSCFNSTDYDNSFAINPLGKYALFLEAFLTSPVGQLVKFDDDANPIYIKEENKDILMNQLDLIYQGIIQFINDMADLNVKDIIDLDLDKNWILENFGAFVSEEKNFNFSIIDALKIEDFYCSGGIIKASIHSTK